MHREDANRSLFLENKKKKNKKEKERLTKSRKDKYIQLRKELSIPNRINETNQYWYKI